MNSNQQPMQQQPKKKFNYGVGFGIVIGLSALVFFGSAILKAVLVEQGADFAPIANFISSISIMASMGIVMIGSVIVLAIGASKK